MKTLKEYINEGLFSAFRIQSQLTKARGKVFDYFEEHLNDYKSEIEMTRDLKRIAKEAYDEFVKEPDAIPFNAWFRDFEKSFMNYIKNTRK